jgi:hypothetical protein
MKKITLILFSVSLLLFAFPTNINADNVKIFNNQRTLKLAEKQSAQVLITRLFEIKKLEKSNLTIKEKNKLRLEVNKINTELKTIGDGIYLSLGTLVVILILLIILF